MRQETETETTSEAASAAEPSNGVTPVAKKAKAKKAAKPKKAAAKKQAKAKKAKPVKKAAKAAKAAKPKKAAAKKAAKVGKREQTGEGLAGELRLNEGPRAVMAKNLERNKGSFVTLASLAKAFDGNEALARGAIIRFRSKIVKYKLPYEIRTDEEKVGRYGLFAKR